jgi:hypothetical protein
MMEKRTTLMFSVILRISMTNYGQAQNQGETFDELSVASEGYRRPEGYDPVRNHYNTMWNMHIYSKFKNSYKWQKTPDSFLIYYLYY